MQVAVEEAARRAVVQAAPRLVFWWLPAKGSWSATVPSRRALAVRVAVARRAVWVVKVAWAVKAPTPSLK